MYILHEDIFSFHNSAYAIILPTNNSYRNDGSAIFDDEITVEFGKKFKQFDEQVGDKLVLYGNDVFYFPDCNAFTFPIKDKWIDKPHLGIIEKSAHQLSQHEEYLFGRPMIMPKVGCYAGSGITWDDVKPILEYYIPEVLIVTKF